MGFSLGKYNVMYCCLAVGPSYMITHTPFSITLAALFSSIDNHLPTCMGKMVTPKTMDAHTTARPAGVTGAMSPKPLYRSFIPPSKYNTKIYMTKEH